MNNVATSDYFVKHCDWWVIGCALARLGPAEGRHLTNERKVTVNRGAALHDHSKFTAAILVRADKLIE